MSDEAVLHLMHQRKDEGYVPSSCSDGCKLGLVVEGGGMRGVMSSSMLDAIDQAGFRNCFDAVYGTSAGAINGAYFIAGQINIGTSVYYEDISNKEFISLWRWPDFMDLDFLFEILMNGKKALNAESVISSNTDLTITTTNSDTGEAVALKGKDLSPETLFSAIKASASTPMFTTNTETINGARLNDGLVHDGIPIHRALEDGCTHLVCVLTRCKDYKKTDSPLITVLEKARLKRFGNAYWDAYSARADRYNEAMDIAYMNHPDILVPTLALYPALEKDVVSNGEIGAQPLHDAAKTALHRAAELLKVDSHSFLTFGERH